MNITFINRICVFCCVGLSLFCTAVAAADLPVKTPDLPAREGIVRNPLTWSGLHRITGPASPAKDFFIDLKANHLEGRIFSAPYPFEVKESDFDYPWYRTEEAFRDGKGIIPVSTFFIPKYNANDWSKDVPEPIPTYTVGYRLDLFDQTLQRPIGFYDGRVSFKWTAEDGPVKTLTITEGPFLNTSSDDPTEVIISLEIDRDAFARVAVTSTDGTSIADFGSRMPARRHEIPIKGLRPDATYRYQVSVEDITGHVTVTRNYPFQTAPSKGRGDVVFAFASDSREGIGGGEQTYMGSNRYALNHIVWDAFRRDARLFIFGGDLVNGYTSKVEDFRLQLKGWKQAFEGFWRTRSVYTAMGNHETLLNVYDDGSRYGIGLDKWPYATDSAEALFAQEFVNPRNGPAPSDHRRPAYLENVYQFQYGPVHCL